jgi:sugar phosphate isomerase/epimerase
VSGSDGSQRLVSLAAGTVLDVGPAETVAVAARAGFDGVGLWFDSDTWTDATTREVATRLDGTGLTPLDMEPVILGRDVDPGDALVDTAGALGVRHVLVAGGPASHAAVVDRFGELCNRAAPAGVTVVLEFLPIFSIATLHDAVAVVQEANRPNGGVLVDTLHLARSGGGVKDIATVPLSLFPYLQLADATARLDDPTPANLREEALHGRLLPGEGDLPLAATLAAVPDVPVSVELRSRALMERYPDPTARAQAVLAATRALMG